MIVFSQERRIERSPEVFVWILNKKEARIIEEMAQIAFDEFGKQEYKDMLGQIGMTPIF